MYIYIDAWLLWTIDRPTWSMSNPLMANSPGLSICDFHQEIDILHRAIRCDTYLRGPT